MVRELATINKILVQNVLNLIYHNASQVLLETGNRMQKLSYLSQEHDMESKQT